jgi:N-acetylglucosaminyl-diphospho-decaprenol L-rhamnosyltransferase
MRVLSVVSHGHSKYIKRLVKSLEKHFVLKDNEFKIVIVNNKPEDIIKINSVIFDIRIFENLRPKGFGENHNFVFEIYQPDIIYIVNPDIYLYQTCLEIDILEFLPTFGLAAPRIKNQNKDDLDFHRKPLTLINLIRRRLALDEKGFPTWFTGTFLIANKSTFKSVNGFDTGYFMYVEDCDLSYRIVEAGGKLKVLEGFDVIHDERRLSFKSWSHFKWHFRSLLLFWTRR